MTASSAAVDKFSEAVDKFAESLPSRMSGHGRRAGESFGGAFTSQMTRSLPGISGFASAMAGYDSAAGKIGAAAGRALGLAFTTAAGGLLGAAAYTMFKGFERYEAIDAATHRLQNLSRTMEASGRVGLNVAEIMKTVNSVVEGTPIALNEAMGAVTVALGSGIQPGDQLKRYLTDIADAAGYSGRSFEELALVFGQVQAKGRLMGEETLQFMEKNIPVAAWIRDTFRLTGDEYEKLQEKGQISLLALQKAIEQHAGGMSKSMGETIQGSITNLQTSVARAGANFLGAMFGKPTENSNQLVEVLKTLRQRLDDVGAWITAHQNEIRDFFKNGAEVAGDLLKVLGTIGKTLGEHKELIWTVAGAYAAWKGIHGVASLLTDLSKISGFLRGIPGEAAAAKTAMGGMGAASGAGAGAGAGAAGAGAGFPAFLGILGGMAVTGGTIAAAKRYADAHPETREEMSRHSGVPIGPLPGQNTGTIPLAPYGPFPLAPERFGPGAAEAKPGDISGLLLPTPAPPAAPGTPGRPAPGAQPGGPTDENPFLPPRNSGEKHLPKPPVVPYDASLPPGFENLPMSSSLYGAESSFLDARFKMAEKQARLNQLEHDNNATAQDILDARNDVITAGRDQQQAELRLYEARQDIFDKQAKQFNDWRDKLGELGASLDQDFGISKGLAGIVENVTKMLANLAAAPIIGALRGVQIGMGQEPGAAGSGIVGMLASSGAFGPTLQGDSRLQSLRNSSAGALGTPGMVPGYGGPGGYGYGPGGYSGPGTASGIVPGASSSPLVAALAAKGLSPELIRLIQGFSEVEGRNPAGVPTLGFTDAQLGGRSDLQSHVDALIQQFKDRAGVAGPFPQGGTDLQQAQWIAKVVGQAGLPSQPQDYVQRVVSAMQGAPTTTAGSVGGLNLSTIPVAAQQYANDCIDASARIILSHSGVNMTEDQLKGVIAPGGSIDSQAAGMNRLFPAGRFVPMAGSGGSPEAMFNAIKASIDKGVGSILNVAPGSSIAGRAFPDGHFIAVTGYNPDGTINLSDTARGTQYSVSQADAFQATRGRGIVAGTGSGPAPWSAGGGLPGISPFGGEPAAPAPTPGPAPVPLPPAPPKSWTTAPPIAPPAPPPGSTAGGNALDPRFFIPGAPSAPGAAAPGAPGAPSPGGGIGTGSPFPARGGPPAAGGPGLGGSWIGSGAAGNSPIGVPMPGGGPSLGPTVIGGLAPPEGQGSGFKGAGSGGLIGMGIAAAQSAISAAGMAGDAMGGGGGGSAGAAVANAAIQIAVQEINRAIGFGAQAAGIGFNGLLETFLPLGGSELAQNNWLTRIAGGIVGARPAMPNMAGGGVTKKGLTPEQAAQLEASKKGPSPEDVAGKNGGDPNNPNAPGAHQAGQQTVNNTTNNNVTVNNQRATEDGTGRDLTYALNQQYTPPGVNG